MRQPRLQHSPLAGDADELAHDFWVGQVIRRDLPCDLAALKQQDAIGKCFDEIKVLLDQLQC